MVAYYLSCHLNSSNPLQLTQSKFNSGSSCDDSVCLAACTFPLMFPCGDIFWDQSLRGLAMFFFMLRFIEIGTFPRGLTANWSPRDYYEFIGTSDNDSLRLLAVKAEKTNPQRTSSYQARTFKYKDRNILFYIWQSSRLIGSLLILTWSQAYLETYPYNRDKRFWTFLMPWDREGVLEVFAFAIQLFTVIDLLYTPGTLIMVHFLQAPFTPVCDSPYFSTSLRDFWSNRWNRYIKTTIHRISFAPTVQYLRLVDPRPEAQETHYAIATLVAFAMSALVHEYAVVMLIPYEWVPGESAIFFMIHGVFCVATERWKKYGLFGLADDVASRWIGWIATALFFLVTSPFFVGPFMRSGVFLQMPVPLLLK
ncbi:hypothetical protein BCR33DRAFT_849794, partial [Rhizoclosmatium globosum]